MKMTKKLIGILTAGFIASCGNGGRTTDKKTLVDEIAGSYARVSTVSGKSTYDDQPFTSELRDTIILIKKDNGFEVQDRHWKKTTDKNGQSSDPDGIHGNGDTFQGAFNESDTTISNPLGGGVKLNTAKGQLFPIGHPGLVFTKIKKP